MGRRPLPAVRDLTRDGRWSTYDESVLKKIEWGRCAQTGQSGTAILMFFKKMKEVHGFIGVKSNSKSLL
jgi:hypothetical protein